jgi:16S rRNA U1498 N3-methylase RsmE
VFLLPFAIASFALMFGNWSQVRESVAARQCSRATPPPLRTHCMLGGLPRNVQAHQTAVYAYSSEEAESFTLRLSASQLFFLRKVG